MILRAGKKRWEASMQFVLSHSETLGTLEMLNVWRRLDAAVHGAGHVHLIL